MDKFNVIENYEVFDGVKWHREVKHYIAKERDIIQRLSSFEYEDIQYKNDPLMGQTAIFTIFDDEDSKWTIWIQKIQNQKRASA